MSSKEPVFSAIALEIVHVRNITLHFCQRVCERVSCVRNRVHTRTPLCQTRTPLCQISAKESAKESHVPNMRHGHLSAKHETHFCERVCHGVSCVPNRTQKWTSSLRDFHLFCFSYASLCCSDLFTVTHP